MDWILTDRILRWIGRLTILAAGILAVWWWRYLVLVFLLFVVAPIFLFFQQDYHPWSESTADLASTWSEAKAWENSPDLDRELEACRNDVSMPQKTALLIAGGTYCKIRRTSHCPCENSGLTWVLVHISRGAFTGRDVWLCRTAIGLTVPMP